MRQLMRAVLRFRKYQPTGRSLTQLLTNISSVKDHRRLVAEILKSHRINLKRDIEDLKVIVSQPNGWEFSKSKKASYINNDLDPSINDFQNSELLSAIIRSRRERLRKAFERRKDSFKQAFEDNFTENENFIDSGKKIKERLRNRKMNLENALLGKKQSLQDAIEMRKEQLRNTEQRFAEQSRIMLEDIRETKNKMKEKMEAIAEKENIYTIPNLLCVSRIVFSPYLGYLIVTENYNFALVFMVIAGISDWVDGWIARNYKSQSTKIGSFLDPMADKILIGTLFLSLTYTNLIPWPLTALIVARDVALVAAGFVIRYHSLSPPRTLSRYFDATHATAQLAPTFISKVNTGVQLALVGTTLAAPVFGFVDHPALNMLCYITAATTIISAGSYVFSNNTYKYLSKKD